MTGTAFISSTTASAVRCLPGDVESLPERVRPERIEHPKVQYARVLTIAGSDPSGGAGIQADIKTISAHKGYAMAVLTALTAQNTRGVQSVHVPPATFVSAQLEALAADIAIDAVKIGMLGTAEVMEAVAEWLSQTQPPVVVLDPVMVATSGDSLMVPEAREALLKLLRHTHLVTPNIAELAVLLDSPVADNWADAVCQGQELAAAHQVLVLVKGGHLPGELCHDALVGPDGSVRKYSGPRVATTSTHGTGCALSSAVAVLQAQNGDWGRSVGQAKAWLSEALVSAGELQVGSGAGPVNHLHALWQVAPPATDDFSTSMWDACEPQRTAIFGLDFIRELAQGTLLPSRFAYYLEQDSLYLRTYSRVLAQASALAPTQEAQKFWAAGAQNCLDVELALHQDWLGCSSESELPKQGPVTKHYVDHLQGVAFSGSYGEIVAAVLPCYWLYAEVGRVLHADYLKLATADVVHPYGAWLQSYADPEFAEATAKAIALLDDAAREGSARERRMMRQAFAHSAQYEVDFFAAPHRHVIPAGD